MEIILFTLALIALTLASGYCSCSEAALFSLSPLKVKAYRDESDPKKRLIARLVLRPRDLLVTIFLLNTLVNILLQNTASHMFGMSASWYLSVGVPFVLTFFFGEIIPKYVGIRNNEALSYTFAPQLVYLHEHLAAVRRAIIAVTLPISRLFFFALKEEPVISKEELKHVLQRSEEHGVLSKDEAELVWGYLDLFDSQVMELMRPRDDLLYYNIKEPLTKLTALFADQHCSRVPVCDGSLDQVIGVMHVDAFFVHRQQILSSADLLPHLSKPLYVPESAAARLLLRRFDTEGELFALALDEYGAVVGVITREDILEVVVGQIADSRDKRKLFTRASDNELIASGRLELEELHELFGIELVSEYNMMTVGGWLTEQLGDVPQVGRTHSAQGLFFQVLSAAPNRVRRLYIRKDPRKYE